MRLIGWSLLILVCVAILLSFLSFIRVGNSKQKSRFSHRFSLEMFYTLLIMYSIFIIGFGLIYFILSFEGIVLVEDGELNPVNLVGTLIHAFYFSGVTLMTIGYGDITPIGIGRLVALIEALFGYVLPAAFVMRIVQNHQQDRQE